MIVFIDFDGVLVDSMDEVALNAWNTAFSCQEISLSALPSDYLNRFRENRYFVQRAGEFIPFARWCRSKQTAPGPLSQEIYNKITDLPDRKITDLGEDFYSTRAAIIKRFGNQWFELHRQFSLFVDFLNGWENQWYILTNKDRPSTEALLAYFSIACPSDRVLTGDRGITKSNNLNAVCNIHRSHDAFFIDDSLNNLLELKNDVNLSGFDIQFALAGWGYSGPDDQVNAEMNNIAYFTQQKAISYLHDFH